MRGIRKSKVKLGCRVSHHPALTTSSQEDDMPPRLPSLPPGLCICRDPNCKIPYGECHCRCGEKVALAKRSDTRDGIVKGFPLWYIDGHVGFKRPEIIDADPIEINGYRCRLIPLTQGQFAMVSPHRYKDLMRWKWYAWWNPTTRSYYAVRTVQMPDGRRVSIYMCRFILGLEPGIPLPAIMQKPEIP